MHKISSYGDGASLSRKFAPHLIHADAHAAKQMSASGYGGGSKPPTKYEAPSSDNSKHPKKDESYDYHKDISKKTSAKDVQSKLWDDEK